MQRHHPVPVPLPQWARWGLPLRLARWVLWGLLDRWDPRLRQVPQVLLYLSGRWALWDLGLPPHRQDRWALWDLGPLLHQQDRWALWDLGPLLHQQDRWGLWIPQVL
ncbi:hypothetical protein [uncultured Flavonifractor sp.]|uniref:hypothetical protein n=1 Tax=uncultured Flavonifractor sp. TaxID=1193534 RepID=UPI0026371B30|nr:hypothetical protein [uncultured Flavonifractor sp.]